MRAGRLRRCTTARWLVILSTLAVACGPGVAGSSTPSGRDADGGGELDGELVVFAAASLIDVFDELSAVLAADHPDVDVLVHLAGSQVLAGQLIAGARADVFASADPTAMERVVTEGLATDPVEIAQNHLEIVVERGNPLGIDGLGDLARDDVVVVLPVEQAAAGRLAAEVLEEAGVEVRPASFEADPRAATNRVAMGEADAAIAFRTDVQAGRDRVEGVAIPEADNGTARYPIAVLVGSPNPPAAAAFVALVRSARGRAVLEAAGFTVPA
jgi:molybdate transport system substrate-binding protein